MTDYNSLRLSPGEHDLSVKWDQLINALNLTFTIQDQLTYVQEWADNDEDIAVSVEAGGDGVSTFSGRHWAAKAKASAEVFTTLPVTGLGVGTMTDGQVLRMEFGVLKGSSGFPEVLTLSETPLQIFDNATNASFAIIQSSSPLLFSSTDDVTYGLQPSPLTDVVTGDLYLKALPSPNLSAPSQTETWVSGMYSQPLFVPIAKDKIGILGFGSFGPLYIRDTVAGTGEWYPTVGRAQQQIQLEYRNGHIYQMNINGDSLCKTVPDTREVVEYWNLLQMMVDGQETYSQITPRDLAFIDDDHIVVTDSTNDRIHTFNLTTRQWISSIPSPASNPYGITFDETNIISHDYTSDKIYKHNGLLATFSSSFSCDIVTYTLAWDTIGANLISGVGNSIYQHTGFSATKTLVADFDGVKGVAFDGTDLYAYGYVAANHYEIRKYSGLTSTVLLGYEAVFGSVMAGPVAIVGSEIWMRYSSNCYRYDYATKAFLGSFLMSSATLAMFYNGSDTVYVTTTSETVIKIDTTTYLETDTLNSKIAGDYRGGGALIDGLLVFYVEDSNGELVTIIDPVADVSVLQQGPVVLGRYPCLGNGKLYTAYDDATGIVSYKPSQVAQAVIIK